MMMKKRIVAGGLSLGVLLMLWAGCGEQEKRPGRINSKIVFLSNREAAKGRFDIFIMNTDGSQPENLTQNGLPIRSISRPLLSPDEKEVLFTSFDPEGTALKLLDVQSKAVRLLTRVDHDAPQAVFSPVNDQIVFVKKISGHRQIHLIHRDASGEKNLSENSFDEFDPEFSTDATKIVYISKRAAPAAVWMMQADGSRPRRIIDLPGECRHPRLSPDGNTVVFQMILKSDTDIYAAAIGGKAELVYKSGFNETDPYYCSDGKKIVFLSNLRGMKYLDLLTVDVKTKKPALLTDQLGIINQNPRMSKDGKKVVFESITFGNSDVYMVDVDEIKPTNLTHHPGWDCSPAF